MNLVTDSWVPVVLTSGKPDSVNLMQVFANGRKYSDLAVRPHERIALMRFLICVAQAALDGPADIGEWDKAPTKLPDAVARYLKEWEPSFNLFDSQKPFLQIANLEEPPKSEKPGKSNKGEGKPKKAKKPNQVESAGAQQPERFVAVSKLDFSLASGSNTTLLDHFGGSGFARQFPVSELAVMLLTFQNFSPGGTIGVALWNKKPTRGWSSYPKLKPGQSSHAPCLPKNMLHAFVRRDTVFDTICANLLTKEVVAQHFNKPEADSWGRPVWEDMPKNPNDQRSTETYLGRLVPLTRCIKFHRGGQEMMLANGLDYPAYGDGIPAEASATVVINTNDQTRQLLGASTAKALWRELAALTVARQRDQAGGSLTLANLPGSGAFDLWVGALIANKASVLDTIEAVLHVPANMRTDNGRTAYRKEVDWAEGVAGKLGRAVETYRRETDGGWEGRLKTAKNKGALKGQLRATATRHYWTSVEKLRPVLTAHVEAINTPDFDPARDRWRSAVHAAARDAYRLACGRETPRQIRAFALGWERLFAASASGEKDEELATIETED